MSENNQDEKPIRSARVAQMVKASLHRAGYNKNGPDKQQQRTILVEATKKTLGRPPSMIFTLAGMHAEDVKLFRRMWPSATIIMAESEPSAAHYSFAHECPKKLRGGRIEENYVLHCHLRDYAMKDKRRIWRWTRSGQKFRAIEPFNATPGLTFPACEMLFLDTTADAANRDEQNTLIQMIDDHTAPSAVIGIVLVGSNGEDKDVRTSLTKYIDQIIAKCRRKVRLIAEPVVYQTNIKMGFYLLATQPGD